MKILHTSDWHLGRSLYGRKRHDEFAAFLNWLADVLENEAVDALLVSGDVFDTGTPGNRAQELYYRFLCKAAASCCRHVVVIAGNHDSPSFLNAPGELLKVLNVHVVGAITGNPEDEVMVLVDSANEPQAIVCAVPYLRDRDIRTVEAGETVEDKTARLIAGIQRHYAQVGRIAQEKRKECGDIPVIGMGHLFAAGGRTVEGDGVRPLYVGSLVHVGANAFPAGIDYMALGHLHVAQQVGGAGHIRYSGSPVAMGFGESLQQKKVVLVEFDGGTPRIREVPVPCFQPLRIIMGDLEKILEQIDALKRAQSDAWLEIEYTGRQIAANLREQIDKALADTAMKVCRIKNRRVVERVILRQGEEETLDDLDETQVFIRCLDSHRVPLAQRSRLIQTYREILVSLWEDDANAQ